MAHCASLWLFQGKFQQLDKVLYFYMNIVIISFHTRSDFIFSLHYHLTGGCDNGVIVLFFFFQEIRQLAKSPLVRQSTSCKEVLARVLSEAAILRARPPEEISILMRAGVQAPPINGGMCTFMCECACVSCVARAYVCMCVFL